MIFVNFKTYSQGTGRKAVVLANSIRQVSLMTGVKIIPVVQPTDIREVVELIETEVWSQKIDPVGFGAHTGAVLAQAVFQDGARGTFLNHSEAKFEDFESLEKAQKSAAKSDLQTLIFASNINELERVIDLKPNFVAYEPPELIGSKESSVAQAKPKVISRAAKICKKRQIPLIVGAGVKSKEDVVKSLKLGAVGVALSSSVVESHEPHEVLLELAEGFK